MWRARQQKLAGRRSPAQDTHYGKAKRKRPAEGDDRQRDYDNGPRKACERPKRKRWRKGDCGARKRARFK